ncbi:hypothetical protein PUNSTDRAFT_142805 [Punctularia strigosozonata HHB-11173 SS5]|uniref:uncharacterized protein n=1 Tax=Punctularia strigosozonata (strain HHB-11173) TaxID=741275 RepID=UPI0004416A84|nr:uncharacterized protein PUNSTDRAFT_142805 [Punctularia strigosozonata HHB-11173 SS5]EIN10913.1 hypothetical protein PUNSTDRAFT_142805 [Punctularia strigosozonata HHB-11173 SS5]
MAAEFINFRDAADIPLTLVEHIKDAVDNLPRLSPSEIDLADSCPICLVAFDSIVEDAGEASLFAHHSSEPAVTSVTKVEGCGHLFCTRDLKEWINGLHGTCPSCRHPFLEIHVPDDESSDGGEYIPGEPDAEDDDMELDVTEAEDETDEDGFDVDLIDEPEIYSDVENRGSYEDASGYPRSHPNYDDNFESNNSPIGLHVGVRNRDVPEIITTDYGVTGIASHTRYEGPSFAYDYDESDADYSPSSMDDGSTSDELTDDDAGSDTELSSIEEFVADPCTERCPNPEVGCDSIRSNHPSLLIPPADEC